MEQLLAENAALTGGELVFGLQAIAPELILATAIVLFLVGRMLLPRIRYGAHFLAGTGAVLALALATGAALSTAGEIFGGMLIHDAFGRSFRVLLLFALLLVVLLTFLSRIPPPVVATEFYVLLFGACLGMCLMVTANHLVMIMLGAEMASLPGYALVGIRKQDRLATEAALKYAIFGAASSGVLFFGLSLLAVTTGAVHMPTMADRLALLAGEAGHRPAELLAVATGLVLVTTGLGFKLSLVPFHFWTPDAFEGATAEVGAFLSVASKLAALGLLMRLLFAWGAPVASFEGRTADAVTLALVGEVGGDRHAWPGVVPLRPARTMVNVLGLVGVLTCTFGNLAAYGQNNIKRLLAYSTIAHAGYLAMGLAAVAGVLADAAPIARQLAASVIFYASVYLVMNLGIFAIVAFLRNSRGTEDLDLLAGAGRENPRLLVAAAIFLFSLTGLPPLAGFVAKFVLFVSMAQAGFWLLVFAGVVNTVLSLFYYLRVIKVLAISEPLDSLSTTPDGTTGLQALFALALAVTIVVLGLWWSGLFAFCEYAASSLANVC